MMDIASHRGVAVVLLLLTVPILELLRRVFRTPFADVRAMAIMAACSLAIATAILLGFALVFHMWPFS